MDKKIQVGGIYRLCGASIRVEADERCDAFNSKPELCDFEDNALVGVEELLTYVNEEHDIKTEAARVVGVGSYGLPTMAIVDLCYFRQISPLEAIASASSIPWLAQTPEQFLCAVDGCENFRRLTVEVEIEVPSDLDMSIVCEQCANLETEESLGKLAELARNSALVGDDSWSIAFEDDYDDEDQILYTHALYYPRGLVGPRPTVHLQTLTSADMVSAIQQNREEADGGETIVLNEAGMRRVLQAIAHVAPDLLDEAIEYSAKLA
jgi:hypothetical protein